jgi:hypothetical protein
MSKVKSFAVGLTALAVTASIPATTFAAFGPANRATFTCSTPTTCVGADYVAFNSFTNAPNYGDERAFFDGKDVTDVNGKFTDVMNVKNGQEVQLRVYVHNNADPKRTAAGQAIAKNTTVKVQLPQSKKTETYAVANIFADNANPGLVNDTLTFKGDKAFTLAYVPGSAKVERRLDGQNWTVESISDSVVTTGANLGDWKGCFEYSGFVTLTVKVAMDTPTTPVTPVTPVTPAKPVSLPKTGPAEVVATVAGVSILGAMAHRLFAGRRLNRQ